MKAGLRIPHIRRCEAFVFQQNKRNDERKLHSKHREEEDCKRFDDIPQESNACSKVNLRKSVYFKGGFVNDVEIKSEQPAPGNKRCQAATAYLASKEEFEADYRNNEHEGGCVLGVDKNFPGVDKDSVVEAWDGVGSFRFRFNFFRYFVVFRRDYKDLSAGQTACAFSDVFAVECDKSIAVWAVELDCHSEFVSRAS